MNSGWSIKWEEKAKKQLAKLSHPVQRDIVEYLNTRIRHASDPRFYGKSLSGPLRGVWRYRVGDYRILCRIKDKEIAILIVDVGHRKEIYQ